MIHVLLAAAILLSPAQIDSTLTKTEHAFTNYIYTGLGARTIAMLKSNTPRYEKLSDPKAFVDAVNADLSKITHDKHVQIMYPFNTTLLGHSAPSKAAMHQLMVSYNNGFDEVRRLQGNVGYLAFSGFSDDASVSRTIAAAMQFLAGTDALIIDLRNNTGGSPVAAQTLEAYFFKDQQQITSIIWRDPKTGIVSTNQQYTAATVPGPLYLDKPVYLLTSNQTFSCAEQFTYDLHNLHRVTIVGETTGGGANPGDLVPIASDMAFFVPNGRAYSPVTKTNWESIGIAPDVNVSAKDALIRAYGITLRAALKSDPQHGIQDEIKQALADPKKALEQAP